MLNCLKSFPLGSAPGPIGLIVNHLKEAVLCPTPSRASSTLKSISKIVNLLCSGQAPLDLIPHFCGATLLASQKKYGNHHPVGEVLRRLFSKCLARTVHLEVSNILAPLQVGVGIPAGSEAVVHAVNSIQNDHTIPPFHKWTLLLDFSNAFNSIDCRQMFKEARSCIPSLSTWLEFCYSSPSFLHVGDHTINSICGVQQGDPLGPLGFALTLHPIIEKVKSEVRAYWQTPGIWMMVPFVAHLVILTWLYL